jgi:hypothetical protein
MTDCFGSLERADAALCFLPEMEFTPFVVASTEAGHDQVWLRWR